MARLDLANQWTLLTGASSGLGWEMALQLAEQHRTHLVLVARRRAKLEELAQKVEAFKIQTRIIDADLTKSTDIARVLNELKDVPSLQGAVLNAGTTYFGHVLEQPDDALDSIFATNALALVRLAQPLAKRFVQTKNNGGLLLVSSLAGFTPMPYQSVYGATKAFVTSFGRSLNHELAGTGVSVTVFTPGGIATEMLDKAGMGHHFKKGSVGVMNADACAKVALDAFVRRKPLSVPGMLNKFLATTFKVIPHQWLLPSIGRTYQKALKKPENP